MSWSSKNRLRDAGKERVRGSSLGSRDLTYVGAEVLTADGSETRNYANGFSGGVSDYQGYGVVFHPYKQSWVTRANKRKRVVTRRRCY